MCYAIPGKVIETDGKYALVDYFGKSQRILTDLISPRPGDYIYAQGGLAISIIKPDEARSILSEWQDLFSEMEQLDNKLSSTVLPAGSPRIQSLLARAMRPGINNKEAQELLGIDLPQDLRSILETANQIRSNHHGNASCVHGIIEFSNYCNNQCLYCGIRSPSAPQRFRMTPDQIVAIARNAVDTYGFRAILIQSGEDPWYSEDILESIVKRLRELNILIFLSIGIRPLSTYQKLYDAGARAVLMRFETSNPQLFEKMRPGTILEDRISLIRSLKQQGYIIATGFLVGLPGETDEDIVNNIRLTHSINPEMYSFGPFIPSQGTPLSDGPTVHFDQILKTIALTRLLVPDANILVTTAMETMAKDAARQALLAGANSLMANVTPIEFKKKYHLYDGRAWESTELTEQISYLTALLKSLGRSPMDVSFKEVLYFNGRTGPDNPFLNGAYH